MKRSAITPWENSRPLNPRNLPGVYRKLRRAFGHQGWWPGKTPFEVIVGAILTQNTAWTNVEKALRNLRTAGVLTPESLRCLPVNELAILLKPSGYFNVKAARLKSFLDFLTGAYGGSLRRMFRERGLVLREKLLQVNGIGPETADSILLYAAKKKFFVVDAYTRRVFTRHRLLPARDVSKSRIRAVLQGWHYEDWRQILEAHIPASEPLFNDFHAQIVHLAKSHCLARNASCSTCPLRALL